MEQEEAVNLGTELGQFMQENKKGISTFLETPREWDAPKEIGWKILVDTSFIIEGEFDNMLAFLESRNKLWVFSTRAERSVIIIYTPRF